MAKIPVLDSLYVYKTKHHADFTQRLQESEGYAYIKGRNIEQSKENEINIYHMTAEIDGIENGLTLVTKSDDKKAVEKFFTTSVLEITKSDELTKKFRLAKIAPSEIGIYYK